MRACEFIVEYKLSVSKDSDGVAIKATAGGKQLGHAEFFFDNEGNLDPQTVWVDERYHGQGIARDMYDHLKSLGYTIIRSWDQTDAGRGFWNKHRGEDARVWEAKQKILDPEIYDDVSNSLLKRAVQGALPGVELKFKSTPEGYLSVRDADGFVRLDIGMSMADGEMDFNVENAYLSKYARGGAMTKIIADSFDLAEKKYGTPRSRSLSIAQDRSHGAWQAIANKLGLEYGAHHLNEAITRNKVRDALWHEWQQDAWLDQGEQSPEEMDDEEYNDFEDTVDRIVAWANEQGIESSQLAVTKYTMAMDQLTMAHLTGSQGLGENFADGKVKGKSRPGRVKRAGASCSGSVTSLRAKARKYGGEKGKMYHWCANMKSGRKKNK